MDPRNSGLHNFEWGYLAAFVLVFLTWIAMIGGALKPAQFKALRNPIDWAKLCYLLFLSVAFGVAVDAWIANDRLFHLLYWFLPILFLVFVFLRLIALQHDENAKNLSILISIGYFGILSYIFVHAASHIVTAESLTETRFDVYSLLSSEQRKHLLNLIDPVFFLGLTAFTVSLLVAITLTLSAFRNIHKGNSIRGVVIAVLIISFPMTYLINGFLPFEHSNWGRISLFEFHLLAFSILALAVVIFLLVDFVRAIAFGKQTNIVFSYLLTLVAAYSLTPITGSVMGNTPYTVFWAFMIGAILVQSILLFSNRKVRRSWLERMNYLLASVGIFAASLRFLVQELMGGKVAPTFPANVRAILQSNQLADDLIFGTAIFFVAASFTLATIAAVILWTRNTNHPSKEKHSRI